MPVRLVANTSVSTSATPVTNGFRQAIASAKFRTVASSAKARCASYALIALIALFATSRQNLAYPGLKVTPAPRSFTVWFDGLIHHGVTGPTQAT